jgi:hypothetical protein
MNEKKQRKLHHEFKKLEFILESGRRGAHFLFTPSMIQECFNRQSDELSTLLESNLDNVNQALQDTLYFPTFEQKQQYIESLSHDLRSALIYGYFELIGGDLNDSGATLH